MGVTTTWGQVDTRHNQIATQSNPTTQRPTSLPQAGARAGAQNQILKKGVNVVLQRTPLEEMYDEQDTPGFTVRRIRAIVHLATVREISDGEQLVQSATKWSHTLQTSTIVTQSTLRYWEASQSERHPLTTHKHKAVLKYGMVLFGDW